MVMALCVIVAFSLGCAGYVSKEQQVKCPKCGAVFTIDEGLKTVKPGR
jgi:nitrite reductase/ring-hydroxylating ferredoxin subunit